MISTLTGKNQVTIPVGIARTMGLELGTRLDWSVGSEPGVIVVRVQPSRRQRLARVQEIGQACRDIDLQRQLQTDREDAG